MSEGGREGRKEHFAMKYVELIICGSAAKATRKTFKW